MFYNLRRLLLHRSFILSAHPIKTLPLEVSAFLSVRAVDVFVHLLDPD